MSTLGDNNEEHAISTLGDNNEEHAMSTLGDNNTMSTRECKSDFS